MRPLEQDLTPEQRAFETATPAQQQAMIRERNESATDWYGWCRKCGQKLVGRLADLRAHDCGS